MKKSTQPKNYKSLADFIKVHKISSETIDDCFGVNYFKKNPYFQNDRAINRLVKYCDWLGLNKVKTVYPAYGGTFKNDPVIFEVVIPEPVKPGTQLKARRTIRYVMGQVASDKICRGEIVTVERVMPNGNVMLNEHNDHYSWNGWNLADFKINFKKD